MNPERHVDDSSDAAVPRSTVPVALTIAGSDSGGGAGIQADLKTFAALRVFGTSAITCITAQNPAEVSGVEAVSPDMVESQVRTVCAGFPVAAAKTGMLYSAEIIRSVAGVVRELGLGPLVVDPVMVATSGARLLRDDAVEALRGELLGLATVITPNLPEAEILADREIRDAGELASAAGEISGRYGVGCVLKGGHLRNAERGTGNGEDEACAPGDQVVDVLSYEGEVFVESSPRLEVQETHGTGCTFSAAMTAYLALGEDVPSAFKAAKILVASALENAISTGDHFPLGI
jgi:hydroxymethylpyrimidine/phosphomethylpyrimidine kinase